MSKRYSVGLLGSAGANADLATYIANLGIDTTTWTSPNHPGATSQGHKNEFTLPDYANVRDETARLKEAPSLREMVKNNKFLVLAVQADAVEPYVLALEELNHLLQDSILFVTGVHDFALLYGSRLNVKHVLESDDEHTNLHIQEKLDVGFEDACLPGDVKFLLGELARFSHRLPRHNVNSDTVPPGFLQEETLIESFEHIARFNDKDAPVVTMFSGGLDSTYLLLKLKQLGFTDVHAVAVDLGAPVDEDGLTQHASHFGASFKCLDGRELFVTEGVVPAIRAHAIYLGLFPISSSLTRPVIARLITDYAKAVNAGLLLHTANLSQNSLPRLNNSIRRVGFPGKYGSPYVRTAVSRVKKAEELAATGLTVMSERKSSGDENLWCREFEDGPLGDPESFSIPEDAYQWTRHHKSVAARELKLSFEDGNLVSIDGTKLPLINAIALLNADVGSFGHGRFVGLEPLSTGHKVLEIREAPAAAIIMDALRHLEVASLETKSLALKQQLEQEWTREAIAGHWGGEVHTMCDAAIASALSGVSGSVTYKIDHQRYLPCSIVARTPRYIRDRDEWERAQQSSGKFI